MAKTRKYVTSTELVEAANAVEKALKEEASFVITDRFCVTAYGDHCQAVNHAFGGTAIAIGEDGDARALGENGTAITIGGTSSDCVMAAGLGGKLVWIMPFDGAGSHVCTAEVDGVLIKPGVLYTVVIGGEFVEVEVDAKGTPLEVAC